MNEEQQTRLDGFYVDWQRQEGRKNALIHELDNANRDALIAESKFKGGIILFGGTDWAWDGTHIQITLPTVAESDKIPGES